jgi:hypothetical protein
MDSVNDELPVFQYRNWLVKKEDINKNNDNNNKNNDNNNKNNDNNDKHSLKSNILAQNFVEVITSQQGCDATSSLGGLQRSAESYDRHVIQWETGIDAFQEHTRMSLDPSVSQELVTSSSGQVNNDMITFLRVMNAAHEPWNPLTYRRRSLVTTPDLVMHKILYYIGPKLDAPSIYYSATSEIVTNEAFHSATSRLEGYRNAVFGTISV